METFAINNKNNIVNNYGPSPTLPFDIEGILMEKNGKSIKVEASVDGKVVEYSLRLKDQVEEEIGQDIEIDKEDIVSYKVEEKTEKVENSQETRRAEEVLAELGLEYTEENIRMIEHLLKNGIQITNANIKSYVKSRLYLNKIIDKLDGKLAIKLLDRGINIEEESLQKIAEALEDLENLEGNKASKSLGQLLKLDRDLTYKEAEAIAEEIYGQKMGKDIYDTIIQLHKEKLPINKENINKTVEVLSKLRNIKSVKEDIYVKILVDEKEFNIDNLYKENNFYTKTGINANNEAKDFESFTVLEETSRASLKVLLGRLEIEETRENLNIVREFVIQDLEIDRGKYDSIIEMKAGLAELLELVDSESISLLNDENINLLEENIFTLIDKIKERQEEETSLDLSLENQDNENIEKIKSQLKALGTIEDKDLLKLIKSGENFNLNSIKEIKENENSRQVSLEERTLGKTIQVSKIFNSLGERLSINTVSLTMRNQEILSLDNLYKNQESGITDESQGRRVQEINIIQEEYIKLRNSLTTNMIKESIKDGKAIEQMPIGELNKFIEEKINRYKAIDQMSKDIRLIKGNEEKLIPLIMKNNLEMTLKEIKDINSYINGQKGITDLFKDARDPQNSNYKEEYKEAIKLLGENVSQALKNNHKSFKEDYKELVNSLENPKTGQEAKEDNPKKKDYMEIKEKLSKKDMVLQIPIEINDEYKSLNLIVTDVNKAIDKSHMNFFVSLDTDNLGLVAMDIQVRGRQVEIEIEENQGLESRMGDLKRSLEKIGYNLKIKEARVIS